MRVCVIQFEIKDSESKQARLERMTRLITEAEPADLYVLPELWNVGFFSYSRYFADCEDKKGETITTISKLALLKNAYIYSGSILEKRGDNLYNTAYLINRGGDKCTKYSKIHLFGDEKRYITAGEKYKVTDTELGIVGLSICYDLRFPELFRKMSEKGAELILNCSAWPAIRLNHWRAFNMVRGLENQCPLISCGCAGNNMGLTYAGHSMIVDCRGNVLAEAGIGEEIIYADIDLNDTSVFRHEIPALADRVIF